MATRVINFNCLKPDGSAVDDGTVSASLQTSPLIVDDTNIDQYVVKARTDVNGDATLSIIVPADPDFGALYKFTLTDGTTYSIVVGSGAETSFTDLIASGGVDLVESAVILDALQADVDANTADIATNTADIATNTADIATNVTAISGKANTIHAQTGSTITAGHTIVFAQVPTQDPGEAGLLWVDNGHLVISPNTAPSSGAVVIGDLPFGNPGEQFTTNEAGTAVELGLASKYLSARKGSVGTITRGTPVYISGYHVGSSSIEVEIADTSNAAKMPAVGIAFDSITNSGNTRVMMSGHMTSLNTSGYSQGAKLYVSNAIGANLPWLTSTKPTGNKLIQSIATVSRSNVSGGSIIVRGAGRTNDVPNFTAADRYWYGGTDGTLTEGTITSFARTVLDDASANAVLTTLGLLSLPTSDPVSANALWNDGGFVKVSTG